MDLWIALFLFLVALLFTPGPAVITTASIGFNVGFLRTIPFVLGVLLGHIVTTFISGPIVNVLFAKYPIAHSMIRVVGSGYLLYLAYKIYTIDPQAFEGADEASTPPSPSTADLDLSVRPPPASSTPSAVQRKSHFGLTNGLLLMVLNPKAYVVSIMSLTQFSEIFESNEWLRLVSITGMIVLVALLSNVTWLVLASTARRWVRSPRVMRNVNRTLAILLTGVVIFILFH